METAKFENDLFSRFVTSDTHVDNDYFGLINAILDEKKKGAYADAWPAWLEKGYRFVQAEITETCAAPPKTITFGTSGWRGILGKEINVFTVTCVTEAIVDLYRRADADSQLAELLEIENYAEAQKRGCVVGFDNRFCGEILSAAVVAVLDKAGFCVHYAGESTTGVLSAATLELGAAFSVNLTPSHNPLEYGGYKFNAADAGPAGPEITGQIARKSQELVQSCLPVVASTLEKCLASERVHRIDSLQLWKDLVRKNRSIHGLDLDDIAQRLAAQQDVVVIVDAVHGASRLHVSRLLEGGVGNSIIMLRSDPDVTFGGVAPEPSSKNMQGVVEALLKSEKPLKIGAIIDPDGDRIRFTDGQHEISMNQFGAMAYHFLHEKHGVRGLVAKTVASSNLANSIAEKLGEELFEPRVGFKEFKPVIGKAVVCFEESDGISVIGHTPEKDAYIGLILALDMVLTMGENLGEYLQQIEDEFGAYYPDRDSVAVSVKGKELLDMLDKLSSYSVGQTIQVGDAKLVIAQIIDIDGRKIIFEDRSWLMIRPSGTEPKVRFYVESRTKQGTAGLVAAARQLLSEIGVL